LVERDIDLLRKLGRHVIASITVETDDEGVRRAFTPTSPSIARRLDCVRRLREEGIFTQIAISPMLPNNPAHFAAVADNVADRVIIDTYFDGDGSGGRRSRQLGMAEMYERLGYRGWFRPGAEQELLAVMCSRLGHDRVLFSRDGFNAT
jgi:DNA repair photolyase